MAGFGFCRTARPGEDAIYFDHGGNGCTDPARHRYCAGRRRGEISAGYDGAGISRPGLVTLVEAVAR